MAHSSNLSHRIERLLDDTNFKQAFGGTRRALACALVIPLALAVCAAMVHVEAAPVNPSQLVSSAAPKAAPAAEIAQDAPPAATPQTPAAAETPQTPNTAATPETPVTPETPATPQTAQTDATPQTPPVPAVPQVEGVPPTPPTPPEPGGGIVVRVPHEPAVHDHFVFRMDEDWDFDGDAFAIVGDPNTQPRFFGEWNTDRRDSTRDAEIDKARKMAHGHFILFRRDDKWYFIDDSSLVSQVEAFDNQMQAQKQKMHDLNQQMHAIGEQERDQAKKLREATQNIALPDLSKEVAGLNAAAASLKEHEGGNITRGQLQEIQRSVGEIQRRLLNAEVKVDMDGYVREAMKQLGSQEGGLGRQMGDIGRQMGDTARETHEKMRSIIDQTLKNGQAKPVD